MDEIEKIEWYLNEHDKRGKGHHVELFCVDNGVDPDSFFGVSVKDLRAIIEENKRMRDVIQISIKRASEKPEDILKAFRLWLEESSNRIKGEKP